MDLGTGKVLLAANTKGEGEGEEEEEEGYGEDDRLLYDYDPVEQRVN